MNLTYAVRDGIVCHCGEVNENSLKPRDEFIDLNLIEKGKFMPYTYEGCVVKISDKIAYLNHDIDDACRAGILKENMIPSEITDVLGHTKTQRITTLVASLVANSGEQIKMDDECEKAFSLLRKFMFETVYVDSIAKAEESKAETIVKTLYEYFLKHTDKIPGEYKQILETDGVERATADYISGMSDRYCILVYNDIFIPKSWNIVDND